ncbi:hypothetical protein OIU79_024528 [Salix purpurea]|uniref:Bulb-type lectin domain-containing protein n=1 Tax=Salix purpurea TaxID=77065 RepID=A0A9Q0WBP9_SALPP|nr:hypothetical protein OIU79_024528 [Salix purpurea]
MGEFLLQTYGSLDCTYSLFKVLYSVWPYGIRNEFSQGSKPFFSVVFTFPTLFPSPVELPEFPSGQLTMLLLALPLQLSFTTVENSSSSATAISVSSTPQVPPCAPPTLRNLGVSMPGPVLKTQPIDTLVPSQNLTVNQTLRSGVYPFRLLSNGNMSLTWNDSAVYWNQGLSSASELKLTSPNLQLQYSDGNLRMYSGGTTTMTWVALADQCQVYGYCVNMAISEF